MPIKNLYFDESGFTGYNLLDAQQPVFVIASCDLAPEASGRLLQSVFPRYQAAEFKFSNIWRSNNRARLVEFGRECAALADNVFFWRTDKRFAVLTKVIDFLIEPYIHAAGYDFYADGFCWKYCNYVHYGLVEFGEPALYDSLIRLYQTFSRNPNRQTLQELQQLLRIMANSLDEPIQIFFEQMAMGAGLFEEYHDLDTFSGSDELYVTTMLAIIGHWRRQTDDDLAVFHDTTAHFFRHRPMWETITSPDVPAQVHRAGDGTDIVFPLRVTSTTAVDSENCRAIQLCDVLAGLSTKVFSHDQLPDEEQRLIRDVIEAGFGEMSSNGIRFEPVFPDRIPPRRLNGPDVVDQMQVIMARNNG